MAIAIGTTDPSPIYRALIVDRYTDASWSEYLRARSRADDGRDPAHTTASGEGAEMSTITLEGEGDTITEALYDLSLNVEAAIKRAKAASDVSGIAAEGDGEDDP